MHQYISVFTEFELNLYLLRYLQKTLKVSIAVHCMFVKLVSHAITQKVVFLSQNQFCFSFTFLKTILKYRLIKDRSQREGR